MNDVKVIEKPTLDKENKDEKKHLFGIGCRLCGFMFIAGMKIPLSEAPTLYGSKIKTLCGITKIFESHKPCKLSETNLCTECFLKANDMTTDHVLSHI